MRQNSIIKQFLQVVTLVLVGLFLMVSKSKAQDPNFYIYLCFGQSNMEGQGTIEAVDKTVDSRFQVMQALSCSNLGRTKGQWYPAVPPLCQCWSGLTPADYFGRIMVANLPDSIKVGVINVAVGGCDIRLFDKDIYMDYDSTYTESWFVDKIKAYEGNPYQYLIDLARQAQQDGVIKGILLHQGETNTGNSQWPKFVEKIYNDMLTDLSLNADEIPLLAGEVLAAPGSCCASMNTIINRLPDTIPTAYVISSSGLEGKDNAHFNSAGYRELGKRYAVQMLAIMGITPTQIKDEPATPDGFGLQQNYPNPFNPKTLIKFNLPHTGNVTLDVLDITGRTVKKLLENVESIGEHAILFDGSNLPSGMYFYRLRTSTGLAQCKKMLLVN